MQSLKILKQVYLNESIAIKEWAQSNLIAINSYSSEFTANSRDDLCPWINSKQRN